MDWVKMVEEFNRQNSQEIPRIPTAHLSPEKVVLRLRLMMEELGELSTAMHEKNLPEIADGVVDLLYVVLGTALAYGFAPLLDILFKEVHASNMSKDFITNDNGQKGGVKGARYFKPRVGELLDDYADACRAVYQGVPPPPK